MWIAKMMLEGIEKKDDTARRTVKVVRLGSM